MKKISTSIIWVIFTGLLIANIYTFMLGIHISDEIRLYEKNITQLQQDNADKEKKLYQTESLEYATTMATKYDFTQKISPIFIEDLTIAKNN